MSARKVSKRAKFAHVAKIRRARWVDYKNKDREAMMNCFVLGFGAIKLVRDQFGLKAEGIDPFSVFPALAPTTSRAHVRVSGEGEA